jgi:hypothetical protein
MEEKSSYKIWLESTEKGHLGVEGVNNRTKLKGKGKVFPVLN